MIIVTGATGKLGQGIVEQLIGRVPAEEVGISVRDPKKARDFEERGIRVRQGDFADPSSLRVAFEGASQVLIISSNSSGDDAVTHHRNAIEAAKAVGAGRILYTSHMGSNPNSHFAPMRDHAATEEILQSCDVPFTSLRNGFYMDSALMLLGPALSTGQLLAPEDGPVSWTTHTDLAEATAIALTNEGCLNGLTPPLTSSQALDLADIAALISEISGRPITRTLVADEEYRQSMLSRGIPELRATLLLGLFAASRQSEFSAVDSTLESLLDRPPISMRHVLMDYLEHRLTDRPG